MHRLLKDHQKAPDNPWMLTWSGIAVDLVKPTPEMISLEDIAHALSRIARFSGHTMGYCFYSVAQHSVLVSKIVEKLTDDPLAARYGLLHDAHKAYIGDMTSPVKLAIGAAGMARLNKTSLALDEAIYSYVGLPPISHDLAMAVKQADMIALATERRDLIPDCGPDWQLGVEPVTVEIVAEVPEMSYARFMERYLEISTALNLSAVEQRQACRRRVIYTWSFDTRAVRQRKDAK